LRPGFIYDRTLDRLDAHRFIGDVQGAGSFTRRGANPASELREIVCGVQYRERGTPISPVNEIIPVGDDVVHRARLMTKRDAAIHAARTLFCEFSIFEWDDELLKVLDTIGHRAVSPALAFDFDKTCCFTHGGSTFARAVAREFTTPLGRDLPILQCLTKIPWHDFDKFRQHLLPMFENIARLLTACIVRILFDNAA